MADSEGAKDASGEDATRAELEQLRARVAQLEAGGAEGAPRHRVRSFFAAVLIIIGCVLAPLAAVAAWTANIVGDTDRYVDTVAPLASDPDIQNAVANRVTDVVADKLDLTALLQGAAPANRPLLEKALGKLGDSLESAVESFVHDKTQEIVASDAFKKIWTDANRRVHSAVDEALTGSADSAVKLNQNTVTIDLAPVIEQVKQRLVDSGMTVAANIPDIHTNFTVVQGKDIGRLKTAFRLLQLAGFWLPVLAVLLVAGGVLLSTHRRRTLITAALCFAFATALLNAGLIVFRDVYLGNLPESISQPAAESVYDTLTRFLRGSVRMVVTLGIVVALAAWMTGPGRVPRVGRQMWHAGIGATRGAADRAGLRTGPVGPFVQHRRAWITWILVGGFILWFILWPYPTGWVVTGLALGLLFALAVVDFVAEDEDTAKPAEPGTPEPSGTS
ncbi:hypothetical protein GR925_11390 [Streptomyces sp. HUCO-GS316]|uniref:hypothetical protein n=1 Tax=Streptomyces sp. HUCO-GS316 TaxID=2692198 RepID=UPI00136D675F|nr:hypothetical protein [Streptomyces sp. HUCO-GS316]